MATKKTKTKSASTEPVVIRGSHSTRTEYPDGRVEFETHWDELKRDVEEALAEFDALKKSFPVSSEVKVKVTKVKKESKAKKSKV
jgi:hypothetical protein